MTPTRPLLRYHGGKWRLAPWVIQHLPPHRVYVESFGGAGSVLIRKPRSYGEVYNDLDGDVVNLFKVLRSSRASELLSLLRVTPFARSEFEEAYEPCEDPVEQARRLVVRSFMGFGSNGHNPRAMTGFRSNANRSGTTPAQDWASYPDALVLIIERLRGISIENRDARELIAQHDGVETLHYVDPPYLPETRSLKNPYDIKYRGGMYTHEMTAEDHSDLLQDLRTVKGMVVLSGYPSDLYDHHLSDWMRVERQAHADGARSRTEVLWINPRGAERLLSFGSVNAQPHLFAEAAE